MTAPTAAVTRLDSETLAAHLLTQRALELAGKRLLTRERRGQYAAVDVRSLHERVRVNASDLPRLLVGAFDWCEELAGLIAVDPAAFRAELTDYVGGLLTTGTRHEITYLTTVVAKVRR